MAQSSLQAKGLESTIGISKDHIILGYHSDKNGDTAYEYCQRLCIWRWNNLQASRKEKSISIFHLFLD